MSDQSSLPKGEITIDKARYIITLEDEAAIYTMSLGNITALMVHKREDAFAVTDVTGHSWLFPMKWYSEVRDAWMWYLDGSPQSDD